MVFDLSHLGAGRQQLVEVAAPAGGVVALPVAAHGSPIQHRFKPPPQAAGGFRLGVPDRFQNGEHQLQIHRVHRQIADHRGGITRKGRFPLSRMLVVAPGWSVCLDVSVSALAEGHGAGLFHPGLPFVFFALGQRVDPLMQLAPHLQRCGSGLRQRYQGYRAEPHLPRPPLDHVAEQPGFRARRPDLKIQPVPVGITARLLGLRHGYSRELRRSSCHRIRTPNPQTMFRL